jgi:hypothetical protein
MDTTSPTAPVYNVVGKESDTREDEPLVDFEPALKGHRFTALRKKSVLRSFLGGAAVYRFCSCFWVAQRFTAFALVFGWRSGLPLRSTPVFHRWL